MRGGAERDQTPPVEAIRTAAARLVALSQRPSLVTILALIVRALAILAIVKVVGPARLLRRDHAIAWEWIAVTAGAELLTYPAYILAYRSIGQLDRDRPLDVPTLIRIVVAGFGPVAVSGGFGVDRRALSSVASDGSPTSAGAHVSALSSLEWAVLGPVTWLAATGLLISGADVSGSLLWPWVLGVPLAVVAALWATGRAHRDRLTHPWGRRVPVITPLLEGTLDGIVSVRRMASAPRHYSGAWAGMTLYWAFEICALYGAVRTVDLRLSFVTTALAYSTGYLASRRSLPLGGAGLCEVLLVYSLYQLRQPIGPAIVAVLVYRIFNFVLVIVPALVAYSQLERQPEAAAKPLL